MFELEFIKEYNPDLLSFIEQFVTDERKMTLKTILEKRTKHLAVASENLLDEYNVHAIIRSLDCMGVQDYYHIHSPGQFLKPNKSVTKGAYGWTDIYQFTEEKNNTENCISDLKSKGFQVFVSSSYALGDKKMYAPETIPINKPLAIVMGHEKGGVSDKAISMSDGAITIPMYGFSESFNVSVSCALMVRTIVERIRSSDIDYLLTEEDKKTIYYRWIWNTIHRPDIVYREWLKIQSKSNL